MFRRAVPWMLAIPLFVWWSSLGLPWFVAVPAAFAVAWLGDRVAAQCVQRYDRQGEQR